MSKPSQNYIEGRFTYSHRGLARRVATAYDQEAKQIPAPKAPKEPVSPQLPDLDVSRSEAGLAALAGILALSISRSIVWPLSERSLSLSAAVAFEITLLTMLIGLPIIYRGQNKKRQIAEIQMSSYEEDLQRYQVKEAAYQNYLSIRESFLRSMTASELKLPPKVVNKLLNDRIANGSTN